MHMLRIVQRAVAEIGGLVQHAADEDQCRAGDLCRPYFCSDVAKAAADHLLVRPGGAHDDGDRTVAAVMRRQAVDDMADVADRQVDRQGGAGAAEIRQRLAGRHFRGFHRRAGEDHTLGDVGQGQFGLQDGGGGGEGRHTGGNRVRDAECLQAADLFGDGAIERRIAGMHAGNVIAVFMGGNDLGDDLVEIERRGIDHPRVGRCHGDHGLGHQRAGIEADRAGSDQLCTAQGDQVGRAGAGADEVDSHGARFFS